MQQMVLPSLAEGVFGDLLSGVGAEGLAILRLGSGGGRDETICALGTGAAPALAAAHPLLERALRGPVEGYGGDGHPVIAARIALADGSSGVIALWRKTGADRWRDIGLGVVTAAAAVTRALLLRAATEDPAAALLDPLTELPRRDLFLREMGRYFERLDRDRAAGTLILADIDAPERINRRDDRQAGEALLVGTAARLRAIVRPHDLVARLGDSRFVLWLDGTDHLAAAERAEELRARPILLAAEDSSRPRVATLSVGIATRWPGSGETIEALLIRAEAAVDQVKSAGGGHWRVSPPPPLPQPG